MVYSPGMGPGALFENETYIAFFGSLANRVGSITGEPGVLPLWCEVCAQLVQLVAAGEGKFKVNTRRAFLATMC